MEPLKSFALCLCAAILFFSIITKLLPHSQIEKYAKSIINLLFVILIFSGIKSFAKSGINWSEAPSINVTENNVQDKLYQSVITYINEKLKENGLKAECKDIHLLEADGKYSISDITISGNKSETEKIISLVSSLTGLEKDNIYVESS